MALLPALRRAWATAVAIAGGWGWICERDACQGAGWARHGHTFAGQALGSEVVFMFHLWVGPRTAFGHSIVTNGFSRACAVALFVHIATAIKCRTPAINPGQAAVQVPQLQHVFVRKIGALAHEIIQAVNRRAAWGFALLLFRPPTVRPHHH